MGRVNVQVIQEEIVFNWTHDKYADEFVPYEHAPCVLGSEGVKESGSHPLGVEPSKRLETGPHCPGAKLGQGGSVFFADWTERD